MVRCDDCDIAKVDLIVDVTMVQYLSCKYYFSIDDLPKKKTRKSGPSLFQHALRESQGGTWCEQGKRKDQRSCCSC